MLARMNPFNTISKSFTRLKGYKILGSKALLPAPCSIQEPKDLLSTKPDTSLKNFYLVESIQKIFNYQTQMEVYNEKTNRIQQTKRTIKLK